MKRVIVIVMDGCGAGAAPDAEEFGDAHGPSTIRHIWDAVGGFRAPTLEAYGFLAACGIPAPESSLKSLISDSLEGNQPGERTASQEQPSTAHDPRYGRLCPLSKGGKDSVTGHWEMMGIVVDEPFPTYPDGFPIPLVKEFERAIGTQTIGNRAASGTKIIEELGELHMDTGFPILYTSADSVFQVACHESVVSLETLYLWCSIAREICRKPNNVQRVIARPFAGDTESGFTRTERRKDFLLEPPRNLCDEIGGIYGIGVVPELFAARGFRSLPRSQSNKEHAVAMDGALASDARFIFANFEDFDMLYGHRNDAPGFAKCLEEFDATLASIIARLKPEDLLIVTADHGNDPTDESTDHTREHVPFVVTGPQVRADVMGDINGFAAVGATVAKHLGIDWKKGSSLI